LASVDERALPAIAQTLLREDPYGDAAHIDAALAMSGADGEALAAAIEHQLWCTWREVKWLRQSNCSAELSIEGSEWIAETNGHPTVLVSPMTLALADTMDVVRQALERHSPGRPLVLYGEDLRDKEVPPEAAERLAGDGMDAMRRILATLRAAGVFATYADFVHEGHPAVSVQLLGRPRPLSSSFVSLAAEPGTYLLPCLLRRVSGGISCRLYEPVVVADEDPGGGGEARRSRRARVAQLIADLLSQLVALVPHQWLLLSTLTHESPQLART